MEKENPPGLRQRPAVAGERGENASPFQVSYLPEFTGAVLSGWQNERLALRRQHGKSLFPGIGENLTVCPVQPPRLQIDQIVRHHTKRLQFREEIVPFPPRIQNRQFSAIFGEVVAGVDQRDRIGGQTFHGIVRTVSDDASQPHHPAETAQRHRILLSGDQAIRTADHRDKRRRSRTDGTGAEQRRPQLVRQSLDAVVGDIEGVGDKIFRDVSIPMRPGELAEHVPPLKSGIRGHHQRPLGPEDIRFAEIEFRDAERFAEKSRQEDFIGRCAVADRRTLAAR